MNEEKNAAEPEVIESAAGAMFESQAEPAGGSAENINVEMQELTSCKFFENYNYLHVLISHVFLSKKKPLLNYQIRKVMFLREKLNQRSSLRLIWRSEGRDLLCDLWVEV